VTVQHPPPATVSFLEAYLGNLPKDYGAFYNCICAFVKDTPQRVPYDGLSPPHTAFDDDEQTLPMEDLQQKPYSLPLLAREYLSKHYSLGHLSHTQMQLLVKQEKLPARFKTCSAPACPACIFATQHKKQWRTKGKSSHIRRITDTTPGDGTSTDQMECSEKGLVQQSTGKLTSQRIIDATILLIIFLIILMLI
jgi:hypothetical protein